MLYADTIKFNEGWLASVINLPVALSPNFSLLVCVCVCVCAGAFMCACVGLHKAFTAPAIQL